MCTCSASILASLSLSFSSALFSSLLQNFHFNLVIVSKELFIDGNGSEMITFGIWPRPVTTKTLEMDAETVDKTRWRASCILSNSIRRPLYTEVHKLVFQTDDVGKKRAQSIGSNYISEPKKRNQRLCTG